MSGIYIPGMEMPTESNATVIWILPDGTVLDRFGHHLGLKAVLVPDHGRLGDLEQAVIILERLRDHCGNGDMAFALNWGANTIRDMTTIISADK